MNYKKHKKLIEENYTEYYNKFAKETKQKVPDPRKNDEVRLFLMEQHFSRITLQLILEFENRLKKDFVDYLDVRHIPRDFYLDRTYFKAVFSTYSPPRISKSWILYQKIIEKLKLSGKISSSYYYGNSFPSDTSVLRRFGIDVVLFYMSIGSFFLILDNMLYVNLYDFAERLVKSNAGNFDDHTFFKFLTNIRFIRNRLAHTNQCLSSYLENELSDIIDLEPSEYLYDTFSGKLCKTLYFMLKNISKSRRRYYVLKYLWFLIKYRHLIRRYFSHTNLEENIISKVFKLKKFWLF